MSQSVRGRRATCLAAFSRLALFGAVGALGVACDDVELSKPASVDAGTEAAGGGAGSNGDQCIEDSLGGAGLCLDSGMWALEAWQLCKEQGLFLADFTPYEECGVGLFERVSVACCGGGATAPGEPDPGEPGWPNPCECDSAGNCWGDCGQPTDPCALVRCGGDAPICVVRDDGSAACVGDPNGGGSCMAAKVGFDGACIPRELLEARGFDTCAQMGLEFGGFTVVSECGDGAAVGAEVQCCRPGGTDPGTPVPPGACYSDIVYASMCVSPDYLKGLASDACAKQNLALVDVVPMNECGDGSSATATYTCCGAGPVDPGYPTDPLPPGACFSDAVSAGGCVDPGLLHKLAADICASKGLAVTEAYPSNDCADGTSSTLKFTCCGPGYPDVPTPPDPTVPGQCIYDAVTYGACTDPGLLKELAYKNCLAQGLTLTELYPANDCPDGTSSIAKYACCAPGVPTEPTPDPTACFEDSVYGDDACGPIDNLKLLASQYCADAGAALADFSPAYDCPNGGSSFAKFRCCGAVTPDEPPPPAPACISQTFGEGSACRPPELWKDAAYQTCEAQGLTLVDIGYAQDCADGTSSYVKFTCCQAAP